MAKLFPNPRVFGLWVVVLAVFLSGCTGSFMLVISNYLYPISFLELNSQAKA